MTDVFTENTEQNLFQTILGSLKTVVSGFVLLGLSVVVLWKNEGCAVSQQAALDELKGKVVKADAQNPSAALSGKPVMLQAALYSKNFAYDNQFIVKQPFVKMDRIVEMYQWVEHKEQKKSYSYTKEWHETHQSSAFFKEPAGHTNPEPAFTTQTFLAKEITFGKYKGENIAREVRAETLIPISNQELSPEIENLKTKLKKNSIQVIDNTIYLTTVGFQRPEIGDLRIKYLGVKSEYYTAIGTQVGTNDLEAFAGKEGTPFMIVEKGVKNKATMIKGEQQRNSQVTWLIRGFGAFLMFLALMALLKPFISIFEVVPVLGDLINYGIFLASIAVSLGLSAIIIVVAKLFYNPIYLLALAAVIGGANCVGLG